MNGTIKKTKRQPNEWEKMFANDMSDKGLISNIYKEFIQLHIKNKQTNNPIKNGQTLIDSFSKKTYRWPTAT